MNEENINNEAENNVNGEAEGTVSNEAEAAVNSETETTVSVPDDPSTAEEGTFTFDGSESNAAASFEKKEAEARKPLPKALIGAVIGVVVAAAVVIVLAVNWSSWFNKYNRMGYVDVSGRTIADVADASGLELDEFLEQYGLPKDMPANTTESAAYYMIPVSKIAASYGMDFETLKDVLQWDDSITEDTTWGDAEGETTLGVYVGEDSLEDFKEQFGLDDSVNADTKWKEVRTIVDTKNKEANEAARADEDEETLAVDGDDTADSAQSTPAAE